MVVNDGRSRCTEQRAHALHHTGSVMSMHCKRRFQQAELVHCRWAMLGVAGILFPEVGHLDQNTSADMGGR